MARQRNNPGFALHPGNHATVCRGLFHEQPAKNRDHGLRWHKTVRVLAGTEIDGRDKDGTQLTWVLSVLSLTADERAARFIAGTDPPGLGGDPRGCP